MKNLVNSIFPHFIIVGVSFSILFYQTISKLIIDWLIDPNYLHGFLVPVITGFMIWQKRNELAICPVRPNNYGIFIIACGLFLHVIGTIGSELFTKRIALIITLWGLSLFFWGNKISRKIALPISYLIFMVPIPTIIWNKLAFPLKLLATKGAFFFINSMGLHILREGNILILSNTALEVVDACSGLSYLVALLAISAAFSYFLSLKTFHKWILFLSSIPIAIIINIFRLTLTALLAHAFGPETAQGFFHEISGIFVYGIALTLLLSTYWVLYKIEKTRNQV